MTVNKKTGLGRGLTALLQDASTDISGKNTAPVNAVAEIKISDIAANPFQPRLEFEEVALEELAESIKLHGIIQPITVRKTGYDKYEIISGERRTRAAIRAGLVTIPAYIRIANDQGMLEMALIENIHRENLNAIEIALSYRRLLEECKIKQEEVGERVGKNRTTITNYLRLLKLPEEVQIALRDGQISMGHAKPLINLDNKDTQLQILDEIIDNELNVRQVEELIKQLQLGQKKGTKSIKPINESNNNGQWESIISTLTNSKVKVRIKNNGKGEIVIPFKSEKDLERIASLIGK
jgi:ParB family chromosome partitioning protein